MPDFKTRLRSVGMLAGGCALATLGTPGAASAEAPAERTLMAVGFNLDLLPTVLSAANAKLGYAPQVWFGIDHTRLRLVAAHLEPPDAIAFAPEGFRDPTVNVLAAIVDYTFGPRFDSWWIGTGFEVWRRTIEHDGVVGEAKWTSSVVTLGGGYIWRVAGDFYLDAWAGAHGVLDPRVVTLGQYDYEPFPLQAEVSLKIGWFLSN